MAESVSSLFQPIQTSPQIGPGGSGDLLSQAGQNISGAIRGGGPGNSFKEITQGLNKRKRRMVAEDLAKQGITPSQGTAYFEQFRDKLIEFGDQEGAEIVEQKRNQAEAQSLARRQVEAEILRGEAGTKKILNDITLDNNTFDFKKLTTEKEFDIAERELDDKIRNTGLAEKRVQLEGQRVRLQAVRDSFENNLKAQQALNVQSQFEERDSLLPGKIEAQGVGNALTKAQKRDLGVRSEILERTGIESAEAEVQLAEANIAKINAATATENEQRGLQSDLFKAQKSLADSQAAVKIMEATLLKNTGGVTPKKERALTNASVELTQKDLTPLLKSDPVYKDLDAKARFALATSVQAEMNRMEGIDPVGFSQLDRPQRLRKALAQVDKQITNTAKATLLGIPTGGTKNEFNAVEPISGTTGTEAEDIFNEADAILNGSN
jgi:hypothetical protein